MLEMYSVYVFEYGFADVSSAVPPLLFEIKTQLLPPAGKCYYWQRGRP